MITFNKSIARQWSRIGPRGIYGQSLLTLSESNDEIFAISADLGNSSGLDRFKSRFPKRFLNIGISEQNMIGFAAGISTCGFNVFTSSFAPFLSLRAGEQVRMNLSYMRHNVKLVAIGSGVSMGFLGNSHFGLEDISIIRSMPNILILNPCDCFEVYKAVEALSRYEGPAYLRLTGSSPTPIIHTEDYDFKLGKVSTLKNGSDILFLTYGSMCKPTLIATDKLFKKNNLSSKVYNVHTLRPLDDSIMKSIYKFNTIIVVEEHSSIGGLTTIISERIAKESIKTNIFKCISLPDNYLNSGTYEQLLDYYNLTGDGVYKEVCKILNI
tara:strand:- start:629 stop:1603 length:975 start_codon:yes stop_codon:yes gene_type:complete